MDDPTTTDSRLHKLQQMLVNQPRDPFLLYGIAMEHRKLKQFEQAIEFFNKTVEVDPGYCYAYFHRGQTYEQMGQREAARNSYRDGVAAANRVGDAHAAEELGGALELLG